MDALDILWILIAAVFIVGPEFIGKKRSKSASGAGRKPYRQTPPDGGEFPLPFPLPEVFPEESPELDEKPASEPLTPVPEAAGPVSEALGRTPVAAFERTVPAAPAQATAWAPVKASVRTSVQAGAAPDSPAAGRLKIDPKKMIIYSALMKPKFED